MSKLLQINSSLSNDQGQSTQLADFFVSKLIEKKPDTEVKTLDLSKNPLPHLDGERFKALVTPADQRSEGEAAIVAEADELLADIQNASAIVFALPMYNFGIPSVLKSYFDHLARAGVSFKYTENGPVGLLDDKPVYILAARGGVYQGMPADTQTEYMKTFLAFIGLKNVQFIYAEGLNLGEASKEKSLDNARQQVLELVSALG
ncbi:FMN-dependent NADH-azoreductase [Alkalimarinus alittae]|uniref:FMN dependent NADH:quinone oxidoreductase n=1 Tax=Alkalimarinus alittae TaxID=2961619 RepID=A0ABY6N6H9_9ALTE|nr:NAD(P)H-dependent oxidoreductase [Alkalimarinus alittae]UZE97696.1 NAD(P)H-dependent oxidoreductase [Alkalimarinus alittae]